jgi:hypothetical protein
MYDHKMDIDLIHRMDEKQILLKARNLRRWSTMTKEQFNDITSAVEYRLKYYGYRLQNACCGRYSVTKIDEE